MFVNIENLIFHKDMYSWGRLSGEKKERKKILPLFVPVEHKRDFTSSGEKVPNLPGSPSAHLHISASSFLLVSSSWKCGRTDFPQHCLL